MTTVEEAIARYPPTRPHCCSTRVTCKDPCPECPPFRPPDSGTSPVHFQVTYTCNSAKFQPCYFPRPIVCPPPPPPPPIPVCVRVKMFDACGRQVSLFY